MGEAGGVGEAPGDGIEGPFAGTGWARCTMEKEVWGSWMEDYGST